MNSAAALFIPRIFDSQRKPGQARNRRGSDAAESPLTRPITAGTLNTRWG
jgi:hypothetical protein